MEGCDDIARKGGNMSLEYEIDNILKSLDNIDDSFHVDMEEEENEDIDAYKADKEARQVREYTSQITEKCYDLITFLKTRGKYENTL